MSDVVQSNIVDQLFNKWRDTDEGQQALFSVLRTPDAVARHAWRACVKAFGWKFRAKEGLPEEVGNYMVILENNHIIHAQLLHADPYDKESRKIWTAAVYGELEQVDPLDYSFGAKYYFLQGGGKGELNQVMGLTSAQVSTLPKEELDYVFSIYFVEGPLLGCYTPMINPPKKRLLSYPEIATKIVNDFGMGMAKIAYYRPLEMPQYESADSNNTPQS